MKLSEAGRKALVESEAFRNKAYQDSRGLWTIGVGHLIKPTESKYLKITLTDDQVNKLLDDDLVHVEEWLNTNCKWTNQNQYDALCNFLHQYNIDRYPNTRKAFIEGNIAEIRRILKEDFNHADVKKKDGLLIKRRTRELALFNRQ
jgi:lysozyme